MARCTFFKLLVLVALLGAVMLHCDAKPRKGGGGGRARGGSNTGGGRSNTGGGRSNAGGGGSNAGSNGGGNGKGSGGRDVGGNGNGEGRSPPAQTLVQNPPRGFPKPNNPKRPRKPHPVEEFLSLSEYIFNLGGREIIPALEDLRDYLIGVCSDPEPYYYVYSIFESDKFIKRAVDMLQRSSRIRHGLTTKVRGGLTIIIPAEEDYILQEVARLNSWNLEPYSGCKMNA